MGQNKTIILLVLVIFLAILITGYFIKQNKIEKYRAHGIETTARITDLIQKRDRRVQTKTIRKSKYFFEVSYFTQLEKTDNTKSEKMISKNENGEYTMNFNSLNSEIGELIITIIPVTLSQFKKYKKDDKVQVLYLENEIESAVLKEDIK
jgi:hypothetical protein